MQSVIAAVFVVLITLPLLIYAQKKPLSPEARRLTDALAELQRNPDDSFVQERYLKAFPRTYKDFLALFDLDQELYDGHNFIRVLLPLAKRHETELGNLLVQLSKDGEYEADAPGDLQHATAAYASRYTKTFATLVNQLSPQERTHLIDFLADVELHAAYRDYQGIIDHLKDLGQDRLAKEFEVARKKRSQRPEG